MGKKRQKVEPDFTELLDQMMDKRTHLQDSTTVNELRKYNREFDEEIKKSLQNGDYQNLLNMPYSQKDASIFHHINISLIALSKGYLKLAAILSCLNYGHIVAPGLLIIPNWLGLFQQYMDLIKMQKKYMATGYESHFVYAVFMCSTVVEIHQFLDLISNIKDEEMRQNYYLFCIMACKHHLKNRNIAFIGPIIGKMKNLRATKTMLAFVIETTKNEHGIPDKLIIDLLTHGLNVTDIIQLLL